MTSPLKRTIETRPVLIVANLSNSSSDSFRNAFVIVYIAIKEVPQPNRANGKKCVCSITFKPVSPQLRVPIIVPYIDALPLTASVYFQLIPELSLVAHVIGLIDRFRLIFLDTIGETRNLFKLEEYIYSIFLSFLFFKSFLKVYIPKNKPAEEYIAEKFDPFLY